MSQCGPANSVEPSLGFFAGDSGSYIFNTGELQGVLRLEGASIGLVPVIFLPDSLSITAGEGLYNHYRVFTRGKRYGYGARRWPSTSELHKDGSVEVIWPSTGDRPFVLSGRYTWVTPNTLDLVTTVKAVENLEAFEVFLASYFPPGFTDSQVHARDPWRKGESGFIMAVRELGEWLAFPRDSLAAELILDGRWNLGSSPLEWTLMPSFEHPLAFRRDTASGITIVAMAKRENCFGIFTPYGEEKHYSHYFSLFGNDFRAGETSTALSRLVVLENPSEADILQAYADFQN